MLPFIIGILLAIYFPYKTTSVVLYFFLVVLFLFVSLLSFYKKYYQNYRLRWIYGVSLNVIFFIIGYQLTIIHTNDYTDFKNNIINSDYAYLHLTHAPVHKDGSVKCFGEIKYLRVRGEWTTARAKVLVYFKKEQQSQQLKYGDCLLVKSNFLEVKPPQNPSEFNFKRYLSFHNVYYQAFLNSNDWSKSLTNKDNKIKKLSYSFREKLLSVFSENITGQQESSVAAALVLGYTDQLDKDLISAYSSAGAMHVLSVSGLHMGIIYIVLAKLLNFLNRKRWMQIIKTLILLLFLWFYALITGLSPAVLRSATMLSLIILGAALERNSNVYNVLIASAFILLLYNPYLIMEVGFQLSYLAVAGIVFLYSKVYSLIKVNNYFINIMWSITAVSLVAQLATFPLGLLYFHQFPNYFILSNLIVIPLTTFIIYLCALLIISPFTYLSFLFGKLSSFLIFLLNKVVLITETLPYSKIEAIHISVWETWIIYLLIFGLITFLIYRKAILLFSCLSITVFLLANQIQENYRSIKQKNFIVYNVSGVSAYNFIAGKTNIFKADSSLINNRNKMLFHITHNWENLKLNSTHIYSTNYNQQEKLNYLFKKKNFIQFYDKRFVFIDDVADIKYNSVKKLKVDYIVLSKNVKCKIEELVKTIECSSIIIDSSNSYYNDKRWIAECKKLNLNYYSVNQSGAFVVNI